MSHNDKDQAGGLEYSADPEKPSPARSSRDTPRDDRADKNPNKVCPKIKCHRPAPLMDKEQVAYDHWHKRLVRCGAQTRDDAGPDEAGKRCDQSLPHIGEDTDYAADCDDGPPAETIR